MPSWHIATASRSYGAKLQIKIERTKKKGEKIVINSVVLLNY